VTGDGADESGLPHGACARLGGSWLEWPAQQVQEVGGGDLLAEARPDVGHGGRAGAQLTGRALAARQLDGRREEHRLERRLLARTCGAEPQPGRALVRATARQEVVVDLHDDLGALGQRNADVVAQHPLSPARRPCRDPLVVVELGARSGVDAAAAEAGPALTGLTGVLGLGGGDVGRVDLVEDDVVDGCGVLGLELDAADDHVLRELRVDEEAAVVVGARAEGCLGGVLRRHGELLEALTGAQRLLGWRGLGLGRRDRGRGSMARGGVRVLTAQVVGQRSTAGGEAEGDEEADRGKAQTHDPRVVAGAVSLRRSRQRAGRRRRRCRSRGCRAPSWGCRGREDAPRTAARRHGATRSTSSRASG